MRQLPPLQTAVDRRQGRRGGGGRGERGGGEAVIYPGIRVYPSPEWPARGSQEMPHRGQTSVTHTPTMPTNCVRADVLF